MKKWCVPAIYACAGIWWAYKAITYDSPFFIHEALAISAVAMLLMAVEIHDAHK
jgi:nicotinamide riboside transporter PnuC